MAEIRIQERKRPIWPWILLILILIIAAVLIYLYLDNENRREVNGVIPPDTTGYYREDTLGQGEVYRETPGDDIEQFRAFTTQDTMGPFSKEYVMNGMNMLTGAIYNIVYQGNTTSQQVKTQTDSLRNYTVTDTMNQNFSGEISRSMNTAYNIISNMQKDYPNLNNEVNELRSALRNFEAQKPVEAQEKPVRNFFRISGSILSKMQQTARAM
jgi:lipopolysaccharide export system protein LptC